MQPVQPVAASVQTRLSVCDSFQPVLPISNRVQPVQQVAASVQVVHPVAASVMPVQRVATSVQSVLSEEPVAKNVQSLNARSQTIAASCLDKAKEYKVRKLL